MPKISLGEEQTPERLATPCTVPGRSGGHCPWDAGAGVMPISGRGSAALTAAPPGGRSSPHEPARLRPQPPPRAPAPQRPLPGRGVPRGGTDATARAPLWAAAPEGPPRKGPASGPHLPAPRPHALTPRGGRLSRRPWRHRARLRAEQRREAALKGQVPAASAAPPRGLAWEEPTRRRGRPQGPQHPAALRGPASPPRAGGKPRVRSHQGGRCGGIPGTEPRQRNGGSEVDKWRCWNDGREATRAT